MENANFEMVPLESENLAAIGFNAETKQIRVDFNSGRTYEYDQCSEDEYNAILGAPSANDVFTATLKFSKPYRRIL